MTAEKSVSIIIVNFNGRQLLQECLSSVFAIDYPPELFEVIVVDNNSSDDSVKYIQEYFPQVRILRSEQNLGFAGGNQLGLRYALGEYIVLLNSDTRVDSHWLSSLVEAAKDPAVGVVNSKLFFAIPFLELTIHSTVIPKSEVTEDADFSPIGVLIEDVLCSDRDLNHLIWYGSGLYDRQGGGIHTRWTKEDARILLPYIEEKQNTYHITIHGYPTAKEIQASYTLSIGRTKLVEETIFSHQAKEYELTLSRSEAKRNLIWLVQNAGNVVLSDGNGKDRGSVVLKEPGVSKEFYERDCPHYQMPAHLLAFCGASCLIKREVIEQVGFFDESYFMYYEDLDLSLRIWMAGWEIVFDPTSLVYHKHRASSLTVQNGAMTFHLEKNYLAFLTTYFPVKLVVVQYARLFLRLLLTYVRMNIYQFSDNVARYENWRIKYFRRKQAYIYCVRRLLGLIKKRRSIQQSATRAFRNAAEYIY